MRFVNIPILTILLGLIGGITITDVVVIPFLFAISICTLCLLTLVVHQLLARKRYAFCYGFILHTFITSASVGILVSVLHNPTLKPAHYTQQLTPNEYYTLQARIIEQTSHTDYGTTFKARLLTANQKKIEGDILCFFTSNKVTVLQRDDIIVLVGKYNYITPPKNPYQFNYKRYMERKGVYGRAEVVSFSVLKTDLKEIGFWGRIERIRSYLATIIEVHFNKETSALLKTLLLGKRSDLEEDVYQNYIDAGAVHILAISGLHVGIITAIKEILIQEEILYE